MIAKRDDLISLDGESVSGPLIRRSTYGPVNGDLIRDVPLHISVACNGLVEFNTLVAHGSRLPRLQIGRAHV